MSANAVEIRGLEKAFPSFHLGPLDLTVPAGAIYGFVGPNGSGKTTTIDLIFGMGAKDAGSITVLGLDHARDEVGDEAAGRLRQSRPAVPAVGPRPQGDRVRPRLLSDLGSGLLQSTADRRSTSAPTIGS